MAGGKAGLGCEDRGFRLQRLTGGAAGLALPSRVGPEPHAGGDSSAVGVRLREAGHGARETGLTAGDVTDIFGIDAAWSTARIDGGHVDLPRLSGIMAVRSGESSKNPRRRQGQAGADPGLASYRRWPERAFGARPGQLAVSLRNNVMTIIVFNRAYHSEYRYTTAFYWRARSVSNAFRL